MARMKKQTDKKKTALRVILWLLVLVWMGLIFSFSAETAVESSQSSGSLIRRLLAFFDPGFRDLDAAEQKAMIESLDFFVRKAAHFSIFTALGLLTAAAYSVDFSPRAAFLLALLTGALYAVSDEVHQAFVPGRACQLRDMIIDACGTTLGAGFFTAMRLLHRRRKNKPNE